MEEIISSRAAAYAAARYRETLPVLGGRAEEISSYIGKLAGDERVLMEFLYGTMPVCDAADYEPGLMHACVRHALRLRREAAWTKELPEDIFFNYVLYYRVNNEDITDCRGWFYEMLWPLVKEAGCEEAVRRINYWCAGEAAYTSSDERTLGPVGVFYSGSGRCGEESTFLVTALRSVGIAARQVYTPRWAHCDDNHAWVEAWVDGRWRFLGACEPEEVLDKGWFTNASSRAMMVHTRVFSDYRSGEREQEEELTERAGAAYFYNDTAFYARTARLTVSVRDGDGKPVCGARLSFEVLNGAEYNPVSVLLTGEEGRVSLALGLGSIHIHVSKGELCAECFVRNGEGDCAGRGAEVCAGNGGGDCAGRGAEVCAGSGGGDCAGRGAEVCAGRGAEVCAGNGAGHCAGNGAGACVEIVLSEESWRQEQRRQKQGWLQTDLTAPRDYPMHPVTLTKEQKLRRRMGREEAERHRRQKLAAYRDPEIYEEFPSVAAAVRRDPGLRRMLESAYGNVRELCRFLERHPKKEAAELLGVLAEKDCRDIRADVLEDHFVYGRQAYGYACGKFVHGGQNRSVADGCAAQEKRRGGSGLRDRETEGPGEKDRREAERFSEEDILRYVWNPRIRYERITPYRSFLSGYLTEEQKERFRGEPQRIWDWILDTVACEESRTYHPVVTSPEGVLRTGQGSPLAAKTLFVAVCRTLGIPARLNPVTLAAEYYGGHGFVPAARARGEEARGVHPGTCQARLILEAYDDAPVYYVSWTIGRLTSAADGNGGRYTGFETLDLTGREFEDGRLILTLQEGIYRLITTVRLPNGDQLAASRLVDTADFPAGEDGIPECRAELLLRRPEISQMLGALRLEDFVLRRQDGTETEGGTLIGQNTMLAFLEEGEEPTEHFLNELRQQEQEFLASGLKLVFVVTGAEALLNATLADTLRRLPAEVYYDDFAELPELLARRMYTDPGKLPLVLLVSPGLTGRYASSGYNVGSVEMMLRIAKLIAE